MMTEYIDLKKEREKIAQNFTAEMKFFLSSKGIEYIDNYETVQISNRKNYTVYEFDKLLNQEYHNYQLSFLGMKTKCGKDIEENFKHVISEIQKKIMDTEKEKCKIAFKVEVEIMEYDKDEKKIVYIIIMKTITFVEK
jgi:hypothetical protein